MPHAASLLVVDDEPEIRRALLAGLTAQGYDVRAASDGEDALVQAVTFAPDLIILDLMLPGKTDGLEVCRRVRETSDVPIIVLSARTQERQKVAALDLGADDYLTKPFGMDELTARIRAGLRRRRRPDADAVFSSRDLTVDYGRRLAFKGEQELKLTPLEYDILRFLTQNADRVLTHRQVLAAVWGPENVEETQYLRVHVGHLRQKMEDNPARPRFIVTEPGVGYRFRTSDPPAV